MSQRPANRIFLLPGIYNEKPFLSADAGPQEISERNVTLLCDTQSSFDIFILCRGGNASFPQSCSRQDHNNKFLISPVSLGNKRTYRCFGSHKQTSYFWSLPSDLLEFPIPGKYVWFLFLISVLRLEVSRDSMWDVSIPLYVSCVPHAAHFTALLTEIALFVLWALSIMC